MNISEKILKAKNPIDVFGNINSENELRKQYTIIIKYVHPDLNPNLKNASDLIRKLKEMNQLAKEQLKNGEYHNPKSFNPFEIKLKNKKYKVIDLIKDGSTSYIYKTDNNEILKISKSNKLNKLFENEFKILKDLYSKAVDDFELFSYYLPKPINTFDTKNNLKVNVFSYFDNYFSFEFLNNKYPDGIDIKVFAWIANRLFEILGFVHNCGYLHANIIPSNIMIEPNKSHSLILIDWLGSIKNDQKPKLFSNKYRSLYHEKVQNKENINYIIDNYMAINSLLYLASSKYNNEYPNRVKKYLEKVYIYPKLFKDAWIVRDDLEELWRNSIGKRQFCNIKL